LAYFNTPPLAISCSPEEVKEALDLIHTYTAFKLKIPFITQQALENFDQAEFIAQYKYSADINGKALLESLIAQFIYQQIPIGLLPNILQLSKFNLHFILDDSCFMLFETNTTRRQASVHMHKFYEDNNLWPNSKMTRWEEQEHRLHLLIDILLYIPMVKITISFFNRNNKILLKQNDKTPEQLASYVHAQIREAFQLPPYGSRPILNKLIRAVTGISSATILYLFTSGPPDGGQNAINKIGRLVVERKNPAYMPLTFVNCSDDYGVADWMKDIRDDMDTNYYAQIDDFEDQRLDIAHKQGKVFPYSIGIWLVCLLATVMSPDDLAALNNYLPLSKFTLDNIFGRELTPKEYDKYWSSFLKKSEYEIYKLKLETENKCTNDILTTVKILSPKLR